MITTTEEQHQLKTVNGTTSPGTWQSLEIFRTWPGLSSKLSLPWRVEPVDLLRSLPTWAVLWFCEQPHAEAETFLLACGPPMCFKFFHVFFTCLSHHNNWDLRSHSVTKMSNECTLKLEWEKFALAYKFLTGTWHFQSFSKISLFICRNIITKYLWWAKNS